METNKYPQDLVLEGYGVKLKRLTHDKIELLRQWRNDPKIQQYMFYRETITPEMQEKWFQKINNDCNFYFIIEYNGKEIGLINIKDIDWKKGCGESGVFICDDKFLGTDVAYRAHLVLFDYIFEQCGLNFLYAHLIPNNLKAKRFTEYLGYVLNNTKSTEEISYVSLSSNDYLGNRNRQRFVKKWNLLN